MYYMCLQDKGPGFFQGVCGHYNFNNSTVLQFYNSTVKYQNQKYFIDHWGQIVVYNCHKKVIISINMSTNLSLFLF